MCGLAEKMIDLEKHFVSRLSSLKKNSFRPKSSNDTVDYIYNPLEYAANLHNQYVKMYCNSPKKILFLGMNPGPFGMVQTGVPFGEIAAVRDYLRISGEVGKPKECHELRPVEGLNCRRSEVSGKRLWGLIKDLSKDDPEVFFKDCFVYNYCPLAFLSKTAKNITPADLKEDDQKTLNNICDEFLCETLKLYEVEIIVAIGRFAEKRALQVLKDNQISHVKVICIPHPSPRNKGSANWHENTKKLFEQEDLIQYLQN